MRWPFDVDAGAKELNVVMNCVLLTQEQYSGVYTDIVSRSAECGTSSHRPRGDFGDIAAISTRDESGVQDRGGS